MDFHSIVFKELIKQGYSIRGENGEKRVWDISDSKLWYLTPELSKGFLNLKNYPPYKLKVIDTELKMLNEHAKVIAESVSSETFNLIDLGCGDGEKAEALIKSLPVGIRVRYCPVDISQYFLDEASKRISLLNSNRIAEIKPYLSDFHDFEKVLDDLTSNEYNLNIILLLGETISHYEVNELLFKIETPMHEGDILLLGNGYRVGERFVDIDKYKHPLFSEWSSGIVKGIGFNTSEVSFDVRFENGRLEGYYTILSDKMIENKGRRIFFKKGDEIIVGCQYKYYESEWNEFFSMYFKDVNTLKDEEKEYALHLCRK